MDTEMTILETYGNGGAAHDGPYSQVTAENGGGQAYMISEGTKLLGEQQIRGSQDLMTPGHAQEIGRNQGHTHTPPQMSAVCRARKELKENVCRGVQLWMVIILIFLLIVVVTLISLALCSVIHEDKDEKFDRSSFKVPRFFNGSFRLPSLVFTEEFLAISSNESKALTADLQEKLTDLYSSSPALGRYFSEAEIFALRNGSVIAEYQLTFLMPADQQNQLKMFTLSREMVYNVFRQFLYDQDESAPTHIDPVSLKLF
ncbi:TPA-induced transmembrane protein [Aulostomus maculatus]